MGFDAAAAAAATEGAAATGAIADLGTAVVAGGMSATDAIAAGATVSDLVSAGVSTSQLLSEGIAVSDLAAAGVPASELISAGASVPDLVSAGLATDLGNGTIMDIASGNILDATTGSEILSTSSEGLSSASQVTGAVQDASGNITQTFDDGSTLTTDSQGNVINSTEATDTGVPSSSTSPLSNPLVQKVGTTIAQKALSSLLAPATKALATGTGTTGTGANTSGGTNASNTANAANALNTTPSYITPLTPTMSQGNPNYTLSDNNVSASSAQPYIAPTNTALLSPEAAPALKAGGSTSYYTEDGVHTPEFYSEGGLNNRYVKGRGDGTSDDVPAMLANGEFVIPADVVSSLGNGSNDSGSKVLDSFLETIRSHKQKHDAKHLPPDSKGPLAYLLEAHKKVKK